MFYITITSLLVFNYLKCLIIDEILLMFWPTSVGKIMPMPFIWNLMANASKNAVGGICHDNEDGINRPIIVSVINIVIS